MSSPTRLRLLGALLVAGALLSSAGCAGLSHFQFGTYETFDDWLVAREHLFNAEGITVGAPQPNFVTYLVEDVAIRTPVYLLHDATRFAMIPIAAPIYGAKALGGRDAAPRFAAINLESTVQLPSKE